MKILVADDHMIVREGIKTILNEAFPFVEITEVTDSIDLLKKVAKVQFDVIISDISMPPGDSGLEVIKQVKDLAPRTPVIVLSMHAVEQYAVRAIKLGASGYLTKNAATLELVTAVNTVLSNRKYLSPEVANAMADAFEHDPGNRSIDNLSNRELEVFKLLASGKTISEISKELVLSSNTVSTFRSRINEKMGFSNNMELIKYAVDNKLL